MGYAWLEKRKVALRRRSARHLACDLRACPRDAPEPPSTANDCPQQQCVNLKLTRAVNPRATHGTGS